jgi:hypothetical protein
MLMSPELQEIFDRRMQPTRMHALLAVEWFNVEDAVETCLTALEAGHVGRDDIKCFMRGRFETLAGLQQALVIANATMRAKACYHDLQLRKELA